MTDNAELMLRNGTAAATFAVAKFHFGKSTMTALGFAAIAYVVMDWAANLRAQ